MTTFKLSGSEPVGEHTEGGHKWTELDNGTRVRPIVHPVAWIRIDGSAGSAREGLRADAERQGLVVVAWSQPPHIRQNGDSIEWLCEVKESK